MSNFISTKGKKNLGLKKGNFLVGIYIGIVHRVHERCWEVSEAQRAMYWHLLNRKIAQNWKIRWKIGGEIRIRVKWRELKIKGAYTPNSHRRRLQCVQLPFWLNDYRSRRNIRVCDWDLLTLEVFLLVQIRGSEGGSKRCRLSLEYLRLFCLLLYLFIYFT